MRIKILDIKEYDVSKANREALWRDFMINVDPINPHHDKDYIEETRKSIFQKDYAEFRITYKAGRKKYTLRLAALPSNKEELIDTIKTDFVSKHQILYKYARKYWKGLSFSI